MPSTFLRVAVALVLALATTLAAANAYEPAIAGIARQLDRHPLIMVGELHRSRAVHAFLQALLRDPVFICKVDDVVVEFGNSRLQPLADTYASGGEITEAQLQSMWRETAVPLTWNSPLYRQFFETVRDINVKKLCPRPVRLVLGDEPLDWSKIKTAQDYASHTNRDGAMAAIVEREVLARKRRALIVAGKSHVIKRFGDAAAGADGPNAAQILERKYPGALFSIVHIPLPNAAIALKMGEPPSFRAVRGSELENANFQLTDYASTVTKVTIEGKDTWKLAPEKNWPRMIEVVDGLLSLGKDESLYPSPTIYLEPVYQQELRRRAGIIKALSGQDFVTVIDGLVEEGMRIAKGKP